MGINKYTNKMVLYHYIVFRCEKQPPIISHLHLQKSCTTYLNQAAQSF